MKRSVLLILGIATIVALLEACSKNASLQPQNNTLTSSTAASKVSPLLVSPGTINNFIVSGHWADPTAGAAGFGSIPYNLANNDSTSTPVQVRFTGYFNSYFVRHTTLPQTYLGYVDNTTDTSLNNLSLSYVTSNYHTAYGTDSIGESAAYNSFQGYYTYDATTHLPVTIKSRFVILSNAASIGSATVVYAIKVDTIPAQASGSLFKANIAGRYKQF